MTCRDFKHGTASVSLSELMARLEPNTLGHMEECEPCKAWFEERRRLAASMQTLRARTANLEASTSVEQAVLRSFRQQTGASSLRPNLAQDRRERTAATPFSLRLSRLFEIGAYAAVAAAIVIAIFLGAHLLQHGPRQTPLRSKSSPAPLAPAVEQPAAIAKAPAAESALPTKAEARKTLSRILMHRRSSSNAANNQLGADDTQAYAEAGYEALMFCDPLSCATDSQVVRMELPAANEGAQPQMADVVVGYDGVVRAIRFVN